MIQIIYVSTASDPPSESDLVTLLGSARIKNRLRQITGLLLYSNNTYLQLLEGESKVVLDLYDAICKDPRNEGNTILRQSEIFARDFPDWTMGFENLETDAAKELPGFVEVFGGKLDQSIAVNNKTNAIKLLMGFRK
ncbi:MAG: BLUF domain-containing protein [Gallionella sp.]